MTHADSRTFRRQAAGAGMIGLPLTIVAAELLHARIVTDPAEQLAIVAENRDSWYAAHMLVLLALMLAVPAFLGVVHLVRRSRPRLANAALVLFVPGLVALASGVGMELVQWQMANASADRAEMVALAERLNESAGIAPIFALLILFAVAWLLGGIGLYLARAVPGWAAILIALAQPVTFATELSGGPKAVVVVAQIAFAVGLVPLGIRLIRQSDDEWEAAAPRVGATPLTA